VRVGLMHTLFPGADEAQIQSLAMPFTTLLEEQAGVVGELSLADDAGKLADRLGEGKVQLGVFHGVEFAWARQKNPDLKPLVIAVDQQPFARAVIVVRRGDRAAD